MRLSHKLYQAIESIWWRKKQPSLLLRWLSQAYKLGSKYDQKQRLKHAIKAPLPLISIGNISVGGSGKTPFTIWLAQQLEKHHFKPVILCRGDGGSHAEPQLLDQHSLAKDVGDEAVLLRRMSQCPVISGKDRVSASRMATQYGDIILLDDGFQYRQLQRQCDIILIPNEGFGNGHMLPAGPLRESKGSLNRADIIIRTGIDSNKPLTDKKEWHWHLNTQILNDWNQCEEITPKSVIVVSAIARPQRFKQSLQNLGIHVEASYFFPDHHPFTKHDMRDIWQQRTDIAVTSKDAVKLLPIWPKHKPLWVLEQDFEGEPGLIEAILTSLTHIVHESA
ncbi:MAG: tetraacyldisaccharide 4'-kinase [Mariprofundaceae bacterium]|nr:tetraacyldisaccharide 4'-kinase [Mariprofundaceae bacterium]